LWLVHSESNVSLIDHKQVQYKSNVGLNI
jgi:hypothetical protein